MKVIIHLLPNIYLLIITLPFFSAGMDCIDFFTVITNQKKIYSQENNNEPNTMLFDLKYPDETQHTGESCLLSLLCRNNDKNSATDLEKGNLGTIVAKSAAMNSGEKS